MSEEITTQPASTGIAPSPFQYTQHHRPFFLLYLKTMVLTVLTLGIYLFWGRVAITKYIYSHTAFGNNSFDYHATGKEMFIGFLKGLAIVAGLAAVFGAIFFAINKWAPFMTIPIGILAYLAIGLSAIPYLILGKWRFLMSRSSFCNIRFNHQGTFADLLSIWIPGVLLSVVTLGIYSPILQNKLQKFIVSNSRFGNLSFNYTGDNMAFFWLMIKGLFLTLITFGIYSFWFTAAMNRFLFSHTTFNGKQFSSTMTGGGLFSVFIVNLLIIIATFTLGFPIAINRMYGYFFSNLTLDARPEDIATAATAMDKGASALASGLEDAANVVDALSGII